MEFSPAFEVSFNRVIGHEGGFTANPKDRGNWTSGKIGVGELRGTKYGISAAAYPALDIKNLTVLDAKKIYWAQWWQPLRMESMHNVMRYQMFDAAINHGMFAASRMLQRVARVKDDGIIGPITMSAVNKLDHNDVVMVFIAERLEYIANNKPLWDEFGRGLTRRMAGNLRIAATEN
jgi:lysozyme family protein